MWQCINGRRLVGLSQATVEPMTVLKEHHMCWKQWLRDSGDNKQDSLETVNMSVRNSEFWAWGGFPQSRTTLRVPYGKTLYLFSFCLLFGCFIRNSSFHFTPLIKTSAAASEQNLVVVPNCSLILQHPTKMPVIVTIQLDSLYSFNYLPTVMNDANICTLKRKLHL